MICKLSGSIAGSIPGWDGMGWLLEVRKMWHVISCSGQWSFGPLFLFFVLRVIVRMI